GVCLADPDGMRPPRTVSQSATAPVLAASFSPDGHLIAVMTQSSLDVIDSTTGQVRWHNPLSSRLYFTPPVWSPDGSQIAFTGYLKDGGSFVGRAPVTGRTAQRSAPPSMKNDAAGRSRAATGTTVGVPPRAVVGTPLALRYLVQSRERGEPERPA